MNIQQAENRLKVLYRQVRRHIDYTINTVYRMAEISREGKAILLEVKEDSPAKEKFEEVVAYEEQYRPLRGLGKEEERKARHKAVIMTQHALEISLGLDLENQFVK